MTQTNVLVVGAGPVGLTLAAELARYGVAVRIVDKSAARTPYSKALVVWSRTLELLDRTGCAQSLIDAGHRVHAADIVANGERIGRIDLSKVVTPHPCALMLPQSETERLLEAHLATLGVQVERGTELLSFADAGDRVGATLCHADGHDESAAFTWLVGCDGAHSTVRHGLGFAFEGDTRTNDWVLADVHIQGGALPASELVLHWHPDGMVIFFPIDATRWRVVADGGASHGDLPAAPTLADVQALVDRRGPGGLVLVDPVWLSGFRINERKVRDYRAGRVFLAGDAAHVHSPAGGQGMNTGMQDAFNLAWKLALAGRDVGESHQRLDGERLLASYSVERSAVGDQVVKSAGRLTSIAVTKSPLAQLLRNHLAGFAFGLGPVQRAMADTLTELSIGYPASPLNGPRPHADGPLPGERVAPVAGQSPIGAGDTPRFALFAADDDAVRALWHLHPDLLEAEPRPPLVEGRLVLARPDGYVAAVGSDASAIADWLAGLKRG